MNKDTILTGIRSNDEPTIGNYLGAILPMVELQRKYAGDYQVNMFVPDLHSFTTPIDHAVLYGNTIKNLKYFVAAGLDITNPDTFIYRQSFVPAHSELTWILDCFTGFGELSRMTQFKEKGGQKLNKENAIDLAERIKSEVNLFVSDEQARIKVDSAITSTVYDFSRDGSEVTAGLFNYPVLMAADILLYGAKYVPVGDDQKQHLELTRDVALRMNHKFGDVFLVPEDWKTQLAFAQRDNGVRIRSLRNPEKKMSKSVSDPSGTILMSDDPGEAAKKIMRAETDSLARIDFDFETQPGISNLLQILALLSGRPQHEVNAEWKGKERYGDLKTATAASVEAFLRDFQATYHAVDEAALVAKLESSELAMRDVANATLLRVQRAVGLRPAA
jgi:tryptophanyl-tRNA synthetase